MVKRAAGHYCTFTQVTGCHYSVQGWQCGSFDPFCCFCHLCQVLPVLLRGASIPHSAGVAENVLYGAVLKVPEQLRTGLFYPFQDEESLLRSLHQPEGVY